jgi:hypothetical protein
VGPATVGTDPKNARGVARAGAKSLPDSTVRNYQQRPVMDGKWLRDELVKLQQNKPVSPELYNLANRAGTSTFRYLLEQMKFYPKLDPSGDAKRWLEEKVKQQRANRTVSSSQLPSIQGARVSAAPGGYNPFAPGGWLMRMLTPPAAAGTLPASYLRRPSSGGGGGGNSGSSRDIAARGPVNINRLREAIVGKESGGNFSAVNPDSGALGIGQVMPYNVGPWTQKHYGKRLTPQQFLKSRDAQIAVVNGQINEILQQQLKAGHDTSTAIRRTASIWYSGQGNLYNNTRPQYSNGRRYPSINDYTIDILRRYNSGR